MSFAVLYDNQVADVLCLSLSLHISTKVPTRLSFVRGETHSLCCSVLSASKLPDLG